MRALVGLMVAALALGACGGETFTGSADGGGGDASGSSSGGSSGGASSSSGGSSGASSSSSGSGSSSGGSSGSSSGGMNRVPVNHRPSDAACQTTPPPGQCNFSSSSGGAPPGNCSSDAQCSDGGKDGRCVQQGGGVAFCACTYDTCFHDTDCPTGKTCACHGSPYDGSLGNACVPGDCRVDADCGAGGYCSPTMSPQGCGSLGGYYCHTPKDQCVDDSDCPSSNGPGVCTYDTTAKYWKCTTELLCG